MAGCEYVVTVDGLESKIKKAQKGKIKLKRVSCVTITDPIRIESKIFKTELDFNQTFRPNISIYSVTKEKK